jgi:RNA polymerase subunit RPABC4/transcription elongation factor Spt4
LCPNCHSQTETFSGKKIKKINYCICGNLIAKKSKKCIRCNSNDKSKNQRIHQRPEYKILIEDIKKYGYRKTGKKYGVSDNAIRKWERIEKYFNP